MGLSRKGPLANPLRPDESSGANENEVTMNQLAEENLSKVPEVTFLFWVLKIAATTLGETGGDAVSMSMKLGYLVGTAIFAAIFLFAVAAQIRANRFHPFLYWTTIVATTTVGTTLADLADRSLGIGYTGGASILFLLPWPPWLPGIGRWARFR